MITHFSARLGVSCRTAARRLDVDRLFQFVPPRDRRDRRRKTTPPIWVLTGGAWGGPHLASWAAPPPTTSPDHRLDGLVVSSDPASCIADTKLASR
jgi:hypothetical protein